MNLYAGSGRMRASAHSWLTQRAGSASAAEHWQNSIWILA